MAATLRDNIAELTARQRAEAQSAPLSDRIADRITAFTGSMLFVALHLLVFGLWIATNLGAVPILPRFDPSFVVLAMVASVEAIFLSTFVLISQNRMAALAERHGRCGAGRQEQVIARSQRDDFTRDLHLGFTAPDLIRNGKLDAALMVGPSPAHALLKSQRWLRYFALSASRCAAIFA